MRNEEHMRVLAVFVLVAIQTIHAFLFSGVTNTPLGMLAYHGSASLSDLAIVMVIPSIVRRKIAYDIQRLSLCAIVVNFIGWLAYLAYLPPVTYNTIVVALGYAQLARLLWMDRNDFDHMGMHLVRRSYYLRVQFHA